MVIWSEFRMGQYRNEDHREAAPHFILTIMSAFGKLELENYFNNSVVWFRAQRTPDRLSDIDDFSVTRLVTNISNLSPFS